MASASVGTYLQLLVLISRSDFLRMKDCDVEVELK